MLIAKRRGESQGYGFVQFLRRSDVQKALREMNESTLEDHKLQIKLSEKTLVYVMFINLFHIYCFYVQGFNACLNIPCIL